MYLQCPGLQRQVLADTRPPSGPGQDEIHSGTYRYVLMPYGLTNAPAPFKRMLYILLTPFHWNHYIFYLDDVNIHSRDTESLIEHVDGILGTLRKAGLSLELKKFYFSRRR